MTCDHEPIKLKQVSADPKILIDNYEGEFARITDDTGMYLIYLCKKCHAVYWELMTK